jgi:hypothetical protein
MSGHTDSIRRAREIRKEGVEDDSATFEEEWPEDEEWGDEEWDESLAEKALNAIEAIIPKLVGLAIDTAAIVAIPTVVTLSMIALFKTTAFVEVYLATGAATLLTLLIADAKTRLLQRLR